MNAAEPLIPTKVPVPTEKVPAQPKQDDNDNGFEGGLKPGKIPV